MFDKLFSNISGKIKLVAKIMLVLGIVTAIGCIIFSFVLLADNDEKLGTMFLVIGVPTSILVMLVPSWLMYGFGQLIENTGNIQNNMPRNTRKILQNPVDLKKKKRTNFIDNLNESAVILAFIYGILALISILSSDGPTISIRYDYGTESTKFTIPYIITILSALVCVAVSVVNLWIKKQEKIVNKFFPYILLVFPIILCISTFSDSIRIYRHGVHVYYYRDNMVYIAFFVALATLVILLLSFFRMKKKVVDIISWIVLICLLFCVIYTQEVSQVYSCIFSQMGLLLLNIKSEFTIKNINVKKV